MATINCCLLIDRYLIITRMASPIAEYYSCSSLVH